MITKDLGSWWGNLTTSTDTLFKKTINYKKEFVQFKSAALRKSEKPFFLHLFVLLFPPPICLHPPPSVWPRAERHIPGSAASWDIRVTYPRMLQGQAQYAAGGRVRCIIGTWLSEPWSSSQLKRAKVVA